MKTIRIEDEDGNAYILAAPVVDGECHYAFDKQGYVIVVARFKQPAPQFVLAPANPTDGEIALRNALEEFSGPGTLGTGPI